MNALASRVRYFLAALMMVAYLGQSAPAYAHGTDSHSSAGQHNYIAADVYAQLDEPDNGDTFTGTTNVSFESATGHKLVLDNTSMWGSSGTSYIYEFTLEYWGGPKAKPSVS